MVLVLVCKILNLRVLRTATSLISWGFDSHESVRAWSTTAMAQQERKTYEPQEVAKCCLRIRMHRIPERLRRCVFFPDDRGTIGDRVRHGDGRTAAERGLVSSGQFRNNGDGREQRASRAQRKADRGISR